MRFRKYPDTCGRGLIPDGSQKKVKRLAGFLKYLDVHIDNSLTWKCQIENIKGKVSHAIGLLKYCKNFV